MGMISIDTGNPWEHLANAIIMQAVKDYRSAGRALVQAKAKEKRAMERAGPKGEEELAEAVKKPRAQIRRSMRVMADCETFFRSEYFVMLIDVDGPWLLNRLKEELVEGA